MGGGLQPDGTPCANDDACIVGESCQSGVCTAGSLLSCDDGDLCTVEACDSHQGCLVAPVPCWSTVVKLSRSGLRLHGTSTLAASLEIFAQAIPFHAVATFKGTREP